MNLFTINSYFLCLFWSSILIYIWACIIKLFSWSLMLKFDVFDAYLNPFLKDIHSTDHHDLLNLDYWNVQCIKKVLWNMQSEIKISYNIRRMCLKFQLKLIYLIFILIKHKLYTKQQHFWLRHAFLCLLL